jgi:hypothetical protein
MNINSHSFLWQSEEFSTFVRTQGELVSQQLKHKFTETEDKRIARYI